MTNVCEFEVVTEPMSEALKKQLAQLKFKLVVTPNFDLMETMKEFNGVKQELKSV